MEIHMANRSPDIDKKLQQCDPDIKKYIAKLHADNVRLQMKYKTLEGRFNALIRIALKMEGKDAIDLKKLSPEQVNVIAQFGPGDLIAKK
jgi:hypothetical protein